MLTVFLCEPGIGYFTWNSFPYEILIGALKTDQHMFVIVTWFIEESFINLQVKDEKLIRRSLQAKTLGFYNENIFYFATKQENPERNLYVTFNRRWSFSTSLSEAVLQDIDLIIKVQVHIDYTRQIKGRKQEFEKTRVQQTTTRTQRQKTYSFTWWISQVTFIMRGRK